MAKQIKRSEIAEEDLYKDIRDSASKSIDMINDLNSSLERTADVLKDQISKPLKITLEGIDNLNKSVAEMNTTMDASIKLDKAKAQALKTQADAEIKLEKIEQERIRTKMQENKLAQQELNISKKQQKEDQKEAKLKKQLIELEDDQVKAKIRFQKANASQKKILADELILQDKQAGTLEKLAAQNRKLRREREKLNLETEKGKQRLKEINDALDENNEVIKENSDKLKKQKINVGNYAESIEQATGEIGGMIKSIRTSIKGIFAQAKAFRVQAKAAESASKKIKLVGKAMKAIGIGAIIALLSALVSSVSDSRSGILAMQGTMAKFGAITKMMGSVVMDTFIKIKLKIESLALSWESFKAKLMNKEFFGQKPFEGLFDDVLPVEEIDKKAKAIELRLKKLSEKKYDIGESIANVDKTIIALFEYENALAKTSAEIERLKGEEGGLASASSDMTLSFQEQRVAQDKLIKTVEKRMKLERDLALMNVDQKALKIKQSLLAIGSDYEMEQIKNLEFLENESEWMAINSEALSELSDAKLALIALENEESSIKGANEKKRRETAKDDFEKELDFAIDIFENQMKINEKLINSDKTTLAEREVLTEETRRLADSSFKSQTDLVKNYTKKKIDFDKLLLMSDEKQIRNELFKFKLNETTKTRILEIIKERKNAVQELNDIENETADKRLAKDRAILDSKQNMEQDNFDLKIELLEKELEKEKNLREKSFEDEKIQGEESIEELKKRIDKIRQIKIDQLKDQAEFDKEQVKEEVIEEDEKAEKIKEINNKLKNDIIRIDQETLDAKEEIDEKEIENEKKKAEDLVEVKKQRSEDQIAILQALTDASNTLADQRIAKIDEEIGASQKRYDNLEQLAANGNILAKESMAVEAKLMAEQQRKREQMEKRKQRLQLASTVLETYLSNSADPEVKNPLAKTITDTVLLTEFIKSLPTLFDGTENTGSHGQGLDGKGGFLSILHPNERVIPKKNNDLIGNMSNDDLSQLAYNYQNGLVRDVADGLSLSKNMTGVNVIAEKLDNLEKTINNKPEHNLEVEQIIDGAMAITRSTRRGNTKTFNRYRVGK